MKKRDEERAISSANRVADIAVSLRNSGGSAEGYFAALKEVYELGFLDGAELAEDELLRLFKEIINSPNN